MPEQEIVSGQAVPLAFGETRLPTPVVRRFVISNTGTAPLRISGITVPAGYSTAAGAAELDAGQSVAVDVQLEASIPGEFPGTVKIVSDDFDEAEFTFPVSGTVVTPEIAIRDGAAPGGQELQAGQTEASGFGEIRQGSPGTRDFTVANTGNAPLRLDAVTAPPGFAFLNLPEFPAEIAAGGFLTLRLRLDAATPGVFAGPVVVASDDLDEAVFAFPVSGSVVTPEIAVHAGGSVAAPELSAGQVSAIDFGRAIQGTPAVREFTLSSTGSAPLLVTALELSAGYSLDPAFALPAIIPPGEVRKLAIRLTSLTVGSHAGSVVIRSDDLDESAFAFPVTGEVYLPAPVADVPAGAAELNRQTGLREHVLHLTNDTTATIPGTRLLIHGLPAGVTVQNAAEVRPDGTVIVLVLQERGPHSTLEVILEFASAGRNPLEAALQIGVEVIPDPTLTGADGTGALAIEKIVPGSDGSLLLEFASRPGKRYEVQYSDDGTNWIASPVPVDAGGNRCQWIDRGPPRTHTAPAQTPRRFYRVREWQN